MKLKSPERLEEMFDRILGLISKSPTSEQDLARRIFLWLLHAKAPLTPEQLQDILSPVQADDSSLQITNHVEHASLREFTNFDRTVVMVCASLVERWTSEESPDSYYRFIHRSAIDYLNLEPNGAGDARHCGYSSSEHLHSMTRTSVPFILSCTEANVKLTRECLTYLMHRVPASPLSGNIMEKADELKVNSALPFLSYASPFWNCHLELTIPSVQAVNKRYGLSYDEQELQVGQLHLGLSDIGWPSGIQDGLNSLSTLLSTLFVLYIVGIATAGLNIFTAPLTFFQQRAQLRLCGKGLACLSFVSLLAASIIITFVQFKAVDLINKNGNSIGVYADGGERYMVFTWVAVLIMFLGATTEMFGQRIAGSNMLEGWNRIYEGQDLQ
jgi:hypothetical protein